MQCRDFLRFAFALIQTIESFGTAARDKKFLSAGRNTARQNETVRRPTPRGNSEHQTISKNFGAIT